MGSLSIWHWLIVLLVVVLIFGTKKLRNMGSDVGGAVKNFKDAMGEEKGDTDAATHNTVKTLKDDTTTHLIEAEAVEVPAPAVKAVPKKIATAVKKAAVPKAAATKPKAAPAKKAATAKPKAASSAKAK